MRKIRLDPNVVENVNVKNISEPKKGKNSRHR
jgi:hypothetical protein